ncbi:MAG TPA: EAL domain-containing protein, partial [Usitatibacter sp.]
MAGALRVLMVEDSDDDALLVSRQLERLESPVEITRVERVGELRAALNRSTWDIVISDYSLPHFSGLEALTIVRESHADLPFILVSATIGEELAVEAMRRGASDYVMKGNLARLLPAVQRELRESAARRLQREKLHRLAYFDSITGLANRTLFGERFAQLTKVAAHDRRRDAVAVFDVDRFSGINGSLGRKAGDELLAQLGARLARRAADPSHVARVGADQFAVAHPQPRSESEVAHDTRDLLAQCLGEPFLLEEREYRISAKAGIAFFPDDGNDADRVLRNAEAAVAKAKAGAEPFLFYTAQMTARIAEQLVLENQLRRAIENEEFELHYQPKVRLEDRRIVAVEALIRWRSPERGLMLPAQFVPLLEETGMIVEVGAWVLKQAVNDHRRWLEEGVPRTRIAVNVSVVQLLRPDFVAVVGNAIALCGAKPCIDLEITESLLVGDIESNIRKLAAVRDFGLSIAIDDFGTGYSSLSYLAKMPVQSLKIDISFVQGMLADPDTRTLVATIIQMAHSLDLTVVAEGVET